LELLLAFLGGMVFVSVVWWLLVRRLKGNVKLLASRLRAAEEVETAFGALREAVLGLGIRHLPPGKRPKSAEDGLRVMDETWQSKAQEMKHLHKRLVVNLHAINQLRKNEKRLRERVVQLEQMLMESPEYDLRAQFSAISRERDVFRKKVVEYRQLLAGDDEQVASSMVSLSRRNDALRAELRSSRRLIRMMERQVRTMQKEGLERAGFGVNGLMNHDLPPGAFDSLSDVPMDDPEEFSAEYKEEISESEPPQH